jgi:hypothetical protein
MPARLLEGCFRGKHVPGNAKLPRVDSGDAGRVAARVFT